MALAADPGSAAGWAATAGGATGIKGMLTVEDGQRGIDKGAAAIACLQTMSAVLGGVQTFANAGAGCLPASAVGAAAGGVAASINGGLSAMGSRKTLAALRALLDGLNPQQLLSSGPDMQAVLDVMDFCIHQTISKERKGWATAAVVGQVGVPAWQAYRAVKKTIDKTKGVRREENASVLVTIAGKNTPAGDLARKVIAALMAKQYESIMTSAVADAMKTSF